MPLMLPSLTKPGFRDAALFRPDSVVLVADPTRPETAVLARNLAAGGFHGRLYAVGITPEGFIPATSVEALPEAPQLAVLCLPPEWLEATMKALAARGCHAAIVPGPAPDLAQMARRTGVRALGQGSFGLCVPSIGLNASMAHLAPRPGKLALVTQSGALARTVLDWAAAEGLGFSHVIGIGGNTDIGFAMALDWLARDAGTGAVLLDIRRIKNRRLFISAARATARTRPVVAIRAGGRSADGTGLGDKVMAAALRRAGVLRVDGLDDLMAAAETLARVRLRPGGGADRARGDRIAIVTNGIGLGQLAADAVVAGGARLARFDAATVAAFALLLPPGKPAGNPLALRPDCGTQLGEVAAMVAALPQVDAVVVLHAPAPSENAGATAAAVIAAVKAGAGRAAPILVGWPGRFTADAQRRTMTEAGLAVFETPEAAVRGALHLARHHRSRAAAAELPPRDVLDLAPDRAAVRRVLDHARATGRRSLTEDEALAVFSAYGIPTVPGRHAASAEDAATAAAMLGFPVALKIRSPDVRYKSEVGGVVLGLLSPEAVRQAAEGMLARVRGARPDADIQGFWVQRQAARAHELRVRLEDDAMFGPWIGFGQGGTAAELADDEQIELPPLNLPLAQQLISRTRTARLLAGYRDHPPADRAAVADALVRISQVAVDFPEIQRVVINPLLADARGVLAVDAALWLRPEGEAGVLANPPYPAELISHFRLKTGENLIIRPIRPEDAAAHAVAFSRLAPEDVRWRFFSPLRELAPAQIARMTQIDYEREMAMIAVRQRPGEAEEILGVARLIREPGANDAEFAVIVLPEMKGQGLGRRLMHCILEWGRAQGLRHVVGHVLADNAPMLAFMRSLGFTLHRSPDEDDVYEARVEL